MKRLLAILTVLISLSATAQVQNTLPSGSVPYGSQYYISPDGNIWVGTATKKFRAVGPKHRVDSLLALKQGTLTLTTDSTSGAATLVGNTLNIPQYTGGGGGGGITSVTSSTADVTVTNTTTAPVITSVVSGTGSGQLVRRIANGGIQYGFISGVEILPNTTDQSLNYYAGTGGYGAHKFYTQGSSFLRAQIDLSGNWIVNNLATGGTAPTTTGTKKMLVSDANGLVSFENIPSGGAGLTTASNGLTATSGDVAIGGAITANTSLPLNTSTRLTFGGNAINSGSMFLLNGGHGQANAGFGISYSAGGIKTGIRISSASMEIIDSTNVKGAVYAADYSDNFTDRSLIDKGYAVKSFPRTLKDFYTDSSAVGTSLTDVYRYLMPANTLMNDGDKVACTYYINQGSATFPTIEIKVNGSTLTSYIFDAGEITNLTVRTVIFRVSSTILKVAIEMDGATFGVYTVDPITLSNPILIGVGLQKASGSLTAKAGFIQFIPAAP